MVCAGTLDKTVENSRNCTGEFTYEGEFLSANFVRANFTGEFMFKGEFSKTLSANRAENSEETRANLL